ncbi:MAG: carboxymuconolactone decarboxylase family protein [Planctomycetota bacterium]
MSASDDASAAPAWIRTLAAEAWGGELAALRDACRDPRTGAIDHILLVHSLHPDGLAGHLGVYRAAMAGTPGLPKVDRELVALVVSGINGCHY